VAGIDVSGVALAAAASIAVCDVERRRAERTREIDRRKEGIGRGREGVDRGGGGGRGHERL
jgi:hypothetical protein